MGLAMKAEMSRVDQHARHLEALNSTVSMNSDRLKHLALMSAANSGGSLKDTLPAHSHLAMDLPMSSAEAIWCGSRPGGLLGMRLQGEEEHRACQASCTTCKAGEHHCHAFAECPPCVLLRSSSHQC